MPFAITFSCVDLNLKRTPPHQYSFFSGFSGSFSKKTVTPYELTVGRRALRHKDAVFLLKR